MTGPVRVSVIIPHRNGKTLLTRVLADIARQTAQPAEIIVADDGSSDGSPEVARAAGARIVETGGGGGFTRAVNLGIAAADSPFVLILNNDVELPDGWLSALLDGLLSGDYAFAIGKILQADHSDLIDGSWDAICRGACPWRCGHGRPDGPLWNQQRSVLIAPLTAALFRREVFVQVGMLDERFESWLEDVDFGIRCALQGYQGIYVPSAVGRHKGGATLGKWNPDTVRRIARNQLLLAAKHYPARLLLRCGWPILVSHLLWGAVAARHGALRAWAQGKWAGIRGFRSIRATDRTRGGDLRRLLTTSEHEILELQKMTGFDWYWKFYFALT
jgi:GT2 family glycosyltransferase